jgi:hypothetical protein
MRRPCCHSGAWDEKSVGGNDVSLIVDGVTVVFYSLVPAQTGLGIELDRC